MNRTIWIYALLSIFFCFTEIKLYAQETNVIEKKLVSDTTKATIKLDTISFIIPKPTVKTRANTPFFQADTSNQIPYYFAVFTQDSLEFRNRLTQQDLVTTDERSVIDASKYLIGFYPLSAGVYGQPSFVMSPRDPIGVQTIIFERDNNDPVQGTTSSELLSVRGTNYVTSGIFEDGGSKIFFEPLIYNPKHSMITIDYRNGYYALGRADVRFFQPISEEHRWGFATTVSQGDGRYLGADVNETNLFFHYRYIPTDKIHLFLNLRQNIDKNGIAFRGAKIRKLRRNDVDISIRSPRFYSDVDSTYRSISDSLQQTKIAYWNVNFFWTSVEKRLFLNPVSDGRRVGGIAKVSYQSRWGIFSAENQLEEITGLLPLRGKHKQNKNVTNVNFSTPSKPISIQMNTGIVTSKQYKPNITYSVRSIWEPTLQLQTSLFASQSVRFPTLEETQSLLEEPLLERSFDKFLYSQNQTRPYQGNVFLNPVHTQRFGFSSNWIIDSSVTTNFYFSRVIEKNPIQTSFMNDTLGGYFFPLQMPSIQYHIYGWKFQSNPFQRGRLSICLNALQDENRKSTFTPDVWGHIDVGTTGSYQKEALQWQSLVRVRYIGERYWIKNNQPSIQNRVAPIDLLLSVRIYSLRINWGIANLGRANYEELPGYPAMHREEVWGVHWILWD